MKGKNAERMCILQADSWAYSEELYDCHQKLMGRYPMKDIWDESVRKRCIDFFL